jgi:tRNA threonylcarbamoyladenosine biosynthesis protein TsaE
MIHSLHIRLPNATKTRFAGASLADTLYSPSTTIFLTGDLGAGKTTFLQGFAEKLGIKDPLTSPTYALEQRYVTAKGIPFLHLDLYRLKERDAMDLVDSTEHVEGIRCIEWADRLPEMIRETAIHLHFEEEGDGRLLTVTFNDATIPSEKEIEDWRAEVMLPPHISAHCEAVAKVCGICATLLIEKGHIVRKEAVTAAGRLHDLLRFVDFRGITPPQFQETKEEHTMWDIWRQKFPEQKHELACSNFLLAKGYPVVAKIVETHGIRKPLPPLETIEQKILFYADKRCIIDKFVSVEERFADFQVRYTKGEKSEDQDPWYAYTKDVEKELFPDGPPLLS